MSSSAKSVRSDIISAINRDDPRLRALGTRVSQHHTPIGHTSLLDDATHPLNGPIRMSGTSLLRNPSQSFFRNDILPSSSELSVEDSPHTQLPEPKAESVSEHDDTSLHDKEAAAVGCSQDTNSMEGQEEPPVGSEDRHFEKNGRSDGGSIDTESSVSLQTQPVEPYSPPMSPETRDLTPVAGNPSPTPNLHGVQTLQGTTGNIDVELEIFVDRDKTSPPNEPEGTPVTPKEESSHKSEAGAPLVSNEDEEPRVRRRRSLEAPQHTLKHSEAQQRPSVLRSGPGGRARSSSVGHKVRFTGQCSFGETNDDLDMAQGDPRAARRHGRRARRKVMHRSASVSGMDGDEKEEVTTSRREYHLLLREIQALMTEVQRQRSDFRTELRSLASSIMRRHNSSASSLSARPCVCSAAPRKTSRLPLMMSDQDATKDVKKGEEKAKEAKEEEKNEEKEEVRASSRASAGTSTPEPKAEENGEEGTLKTLTLREQFRNYSKFGDIKSDGKMMTLSQADKWFKQAKVIDGKTITTTDTAITFNKFKSKKITFTEFEKYLDEIAKSKKVDGDAIKNKLQDCGAPGTSGTTSVVKSSAVDRLTDTKKFTGSHKLRFDSTGRGKGIAGRKDLPDASGYVTGYKNKNTYDKSH